MQKITPCLWFDSEAEEAAKFYVDVFRGAPNSLNSSRILDTSYYSTETPSKKPIGSLLTVTFELEGQEFMALNGGPFFKMNEAVSFIVNCETQEEIDYFWGKLSAVSEAEQCGWLKDKFGLSWQITPNVLNKLMKDKDSKKSESVMKALLEMKKLDIGQLEEAYERG